MREEYNIINRDGLNMGVIAHTSEKPKGTAVIHHGYPGSTNSPTIQLMRQTFNDLGFNTFTPNTTHNYNDSDGEYREMTMEGHVNDLADCVEHTVDNQVFRGPLVLAGHSAGGHSALAASSILDGKYKPDLILASAPVISGERYLEGWKEVLSSMDIDVQKLMGMWRTQGEIPCNSDSGPDTLELRWSVMQDWCNHDLIKDQISPPAPTIIIGGEKDGFIRPVDLIDYLDMASNRRQHRIEMHLIKDGDHSYTGQENAFADRIKSSVGLYLG